MGYNRQNAPAAAYALAEAQLGKPYVWGGAGPNGFDCSGLIMWVWAKLGVFLPHSTYVQFDIEEVSLSAQGALGDSWYFRGSDPGPYGEPGHVGMFVGYGVITDYSGPRHHFQAKAGGQAVILNAPYTGDPGGIRYDYASTAGPATYKTRPALELGVPKPPPLPPLPKPAPISKRPNAAQLKQTSLVLLATQPEAQKAENNGWTLWYWGVDSKFHPQVSGQPTGIPLYANQAYKSKRPADLVAA